MDNVTLLVDPATRDLVIEDGQIALASDYETVAQAVRATLLVYKGEWFLDPAHGVDYPRIMGQYPTDREVEEIIREAVFQETAVKHIDALTVSGDGRGVRVALSARMADGYTIALEVAV